MGALEPVLKYKFDGIGKAGALATFAALAANPNTIAFTQGILGKIIFWFLTKLYSGLASLGLVVLNLGVAKVELLIDQKEFDGSFDDAFRIINEKGGKLTDKEKAQIDAKVIAAFRKFGPFSRG